MNGRWRVPTRGGNAPIPKEVFETEREDDRDSGEVELRVPLEETFRTESYKRASRNALYLEFKNLSKSTVDGVLAEQNFSYSWARPILLGLAAKTWRNTFNNFLLRWKRPTGEVPNKHFMLKWNKTSGATSVPSLRETGDEELDFELQTTILQPLLQRSLAAQQVISIELATLLNEQEAEKADALFECHCCFSDTTFEQMAACTTGEHTICFNCIQRAVSEALYGQSWGLNIDHVRGQIACMAPSDTPCEGCLPHQLANRAVLSQTKGGPQTWAMLESRLADEALLKSQAPIVRCPFCAYAEIDSLYLPPSTEQWGLNFSRPLQSILLLLLASLASPLLILYSVLSLVLPIPDQSRCSNLLSARSGAVPTSLLASSASRPPASVSPVSSARNPGLILTSATNQPRSRSAQPSRLRAPPRSSASVLAVDSASSRRAAATKWSARVAMPCATCAARALGNASAPWQRKMARATVISANTFARPAVDALNASVATCIGAKMRMRWCEERAKWPKGNGGYEKGWVRRWSLEL